MKVTRVIFNNDISVNSGSLTLCDVVLDDCLKLSEIGLRRGKEGYYLILPSKQDVYKSISDLNEGVSIKYPPNLKKKGENSDKSKDFEEFFHPVSKDFYLVLLENIRRGYEMFEEQINCGVSNLSYRPN